MNIKNIIFGSNTLFSAGDIIESKTPENYIYSLIRTIPDRVIENYELIMLDTAPIEEEGDLFSYYQTKEIVENNFRKVTHIDVSDIKHIPKKRSRLENELEDICPFLNAPNGIRTHVTRSRTLHDFPSA